MKFKSALSPLLGLALLLSFAHHGMAQTARGSGQRISGGASFSLTTSGTSGASTLSGGVLNIPIYSGGSSSSAFSALTASTTANTIDNLNFANTWVWSSATSQNPLSLTATGLTSGSLLTLTTTAGATALNITGNMALNGTTTMVTVNATTYNSLTASAAYKINGTSVFFEPNNDITSVAAGSGALATQLIATANSTGIGGNALSLMTSGIRNTAIGFGAMGKVTSGSSNTAVGYNALSNETTGSGSTALGYQALLNQTYSDALSDGNVAIGYQAGSGITGGFENIVIGPRVAAGSNSANMQFSVVIDPENSGSNGGGNLSVFVGSKTSQLLLSSSVIIGSDTSFLQTGSGNSQTIIGANVARTNLGTDALVHSRIILIGVDSNLDTALANTATVIGIGSGKPGTFDTSVGFGALSGTITNGNGSVAFGYNSLNGVTTGVKNLGVGFGAGSAITTGSNNTVIGNAPGSTTLTTGSNNILIGVNNAIDATTSTSSNEIHIGGTGGDWVKVTGTNTNSTEVTTINGALTIPGTATLSAISGSTQCLHVSSAGLISGTGSDCGSGGGAVSSVSGDGTFITNSVTSGAVTLTLGNAAANTVWGNATGGTAAASYTSSPSLTSLTATTVTGTTGNFPTLNFTNALGTTITGTNIIATSALTSKASTTTVTAQIGNSTTTGIPLNITTTGSAGALGFTTSNGQTWTMIPSPQTNGSDQLFINAVSATTSTGNWLGYRFGGAANKWFFGDDATNAYFQTVHGMYFQSGAVANNPTQGTTGAQLSIQNNNLVSLPQITTDATHTDATVCEDTTSHALYFGSGTAGICLGTSSARYKRDIVTLPIGLAQLSRLKPVSFYYKKGHGDNGAKEQWGFIAEDMVKTMPKLVDLDKDGKPNSVDLVGLIPVLVHSVQEQQKEINDLKKQIAKTR
jgi:hypothetical protein